MPATPTPAKPPVGVSLRLYDDEADTLLKSDSFPDRVTLLPGAGGKVGSGERLRILWGQDLLRDLLDGRYRTVVCGVNDTDNSHGIIAQLVELVATSQWYAKSVTSYARMFQESEAIHEAQDRETYVTRVELARTLTIDVI